MSRRLTSRTPLNPEESPKMTSETPLTLDMGALRTHMYIYIYVYIYDTYRVHCKVNAGKRSASCRVRRFKVSLFLRDCRQR